MPETDWEEIKKLVEWARDHECTQIKVGDVEVKFAPKSTLLDTEFREQIEQAAEENPNIMYYSS